MLDKSIPVLLAVFLLPLTTVSQGFPFKGMTVDARDLGEGFPKDNLVPRGLVIPLGHRMYVLFDIDLLRVAAIWEAPEDGEPFTYGSISTESFYNTKFKAGSGAKELTKPRGTPWIATGLVPGLQGKDPVFEDPRRPNPDAHEIGRGGWGDWRGVTCSNGTFLSYGLGNETNCVDERILAEDLVRGAAPFVVRHIRSGLRDYTMILGEVPDKVEVIEVSAKQIVWRDGGRITAVFCGRPKRNEDARRLRLVDDKFIVIDLPPLTRTAANGKKYPYENPVFYWSGKEESLEAVRERMRVYASNTIGDGGGSRLWGRDHTVVHSGNTSGNLFAIDTIPIPRHLQPRYLPDIKLRPLRPTSIDFHAGSGTGVVATIDGDIWTFTQDEPRKRTTDFWWRLIGRGLHDPHSAFFRGGKLGGLSVTYFDRNGFSILGRAKGAGNHNRYKNRSNEFTQSADARDLLLSAAWSYRDERWYFSKGGQQEDCRSHHSGRVLAINDDGSGLEEFACGLRNSSIGIDPEDSEIYAVDQQGHWVPSTPVYRIKKGGYYGFEPARPVGGPVPERDLPLVYIPHRECRSAVDVVFTGKNAKLGPLTNSMLVLDHFRPGIVQVFQDTGAAVPLRIGFDVPLLKGAVNPADGLLYLCGFQVWGSAAKKLAGMVRMRATGEKILHPMGAVAGREGVILTFNHALKRELVRPPRFLVQRWNYKYSENFGSGHYRLDGSEGQDPVAVRSVHLSADGKRVFIDIPDMMSSDQLQVGYDVTTEDELPMISDVVYFSPFELKSLDFEGQGFGDIEFEHRVGAGRNVPN